MSAISFYHLTTTPLEQALPKLLDKALSGNYRICLVVQSEERAEQLNNLLWTYDPDSFLPHGSTKDNNLERQPILISTNISKTNDSNLHHHVQAPTAKQSQQRYRQMDLHQKNPPSAQLRWKHFVHGQRGE